MTGGYRVEWRWFLMGPLLGYVSGLVAVALVGVLPWPPLLLLTVPLGLLVGGPIGAAVGLVAGVPLALLVGPHLSLRTAVFRAAALGAVMPPAVLLLGVALVPALPWTDGGLASSITWLGAYPYGAAAVLGGLVAARTAQVDMPRTGLS
ncbi:hypothetical protein SAMN05192575_11089 [Nocardioides alpinus]|uniref:Uncharacterized protein n=1 Tax=Nocardioides alpinus TaxID=748909 RepID=A0A1I1AR08_9ACTN|nr:hypothetical protein CXG46_13170 [Nocardioides alpinus]SFB40471.1 hypothetical protein SAMN05192575_11089 [Nocardioides alpinus]